jgi:hypothetical protein
MWGRHFAVLGSLAVILAIAIDPFAQNLIYHYEDMVDDPSQQALLAKADYYNSITWKISASFHGWYYGVRSIYSFSRT